MSASLRPPGRMTVDEFLAWPDDPTGLRWQLVDGERVAMAPASDRHGTITANLAGALVPHLRAHRPGCRAVIEPGISPHVRRDSNVRIPDLAVTCSPASQAAYLVLDPHLVVEVLSPTNEQETWSNIWTYCTIPALQEILVVRSVLVGVEILRRDPDGGWPERFTSIIGLDAAVELRSVGLTISLGDLYSNTNLARPQPNA